MSGSLTFCVVFPVTFKLYDKDGNGLLDSSVSFSKSLTSFSNCQILMTECD